jgi:raffinose/stachyose/melibiose transport system substrate-binding protein
VICRIALPAALAVLLLAGCGRPAVPATASEPRVVRILQEKVEIADGLKRMAAAFDAEHPGVHLDIETVGGGQDYDAALADRFQAGTLPDVFMTIGYANLDPWLSIAEDLSAEPWVEDLRPGTVDAVTRDGRILGNPLAIEGYGFLYNKDLFRQAGIINEPQTLAALETACRKLEAAGILPFANGYAEWWVLGIHNFNRLLGSVHDLAAFQSALVTGVYPEAEAEVLEGWMDLLDLTARHGARDATLTGDYTTSVALFLAGKAALIQQGNWIEPDLMKASPGLVVGVLPMPLSNRPDDRVPMGVPNFWVVNKNSPAKDDAKHWLEWLRSSPAGQKFLLEELKVIPPYKSLEAAPLGPLSSPFAHAWRQGKTLPWVFPRFLGKTKPIAAAMRAYLEHPTSHREFWAALSRAWGGR